MQIGLAFANHKKRRTEMKVEFMVTSLDVWKLDKNTIFQETSYKWYASRHI